MQTLFHKTQQGSEEIATRAHELSARLRRCLILIDGKRTLTDLKTLLSSDNVDDMLIELIGQGLIEREGDDPTPTLLTEPSASASPDTFLSTEFDSPNTQHALPTAARRALSLAERRHRGVRIIQDVLGPMGEDIAVKIERCQDEAALNAALEKAYSYIKELSSKTAADKFRGDVRLPQY